MAKTKKIKPLKVRNYLAVAMWEHTKGGAFDSKKHKAKRRSGRHAEKARKELKGYQD